MLDPLRKYHGLVQGVPCEMALQNIHWRTSRPEELGLIWVSPAVESTGARVQEAISIAEPVFRAYGFEMPLTATFVEPDRAVIVLNINFNRECPQETLRAHTAYETLLKLFARAEMYPYRSTVLAMDKTHYPPGRATTLSQLKHALDPNGIIAPGRYNIGTGT